MSSPNVATPLAVVGRRVERRLRTRLDLLRAGRRLFGEKGLYESRIEDLTQRAGIAKGTLYQYFRDKDDLILAVVRDGIGALDAAVDLRSARARRFDTVVSRVVEAHFEYFAENADMMRTLHQVRGLLKFSSGARMRPLRRALSHHVEHLARRLEPVLPVGRDRRRRARALASLLFGAISGVASMRAALDGPRASDERGSRLLRRTPPVKPFVALARAYAGGRNAASPWRTVRRSRIAPAATAATGGRGR